MRKNKKYSKNVEYLDRTKMKLVFCVRLDIVHKGVAVRLDIVKVLLVICVGFFY
jgi:hypothetical protein